MAEQGPILHLDRVALARGGRVLFADLSLTLGAGAAALVTGPNGVGKSSLLRLAAGLLRAKAGRVTVTGSRALLAEAAALDGEVTLAAALAFWARMDGAGDDAARVGRALEAMALTPLARVPVRLLSAGQRRRAGLARVAASRATLWLLDEPATGLDAASITRLEALIAAHRAGGGAVMLATHQAVAMPGAVSVALAPVRSGYADECHADDPEAQGGQADRDFTPRAGFVAEEGIMPVPLPAGPRPGDRASGGRTAQ